MKQESTQEFSKLRAFFWPVYSHELKKLLPMFLIFFCISFNYTVLRDTKDTLVVSGSGAETIPFLKFWGVVPAAFLFMMIYARMSNTLSKENLFYATITPFIIFFGIFAYILYPNRELLHPTTSADYMQSILPLGMAGLVSCYRDWTFSLFYICAELWGSAVLSLLFWGFANDIMRVTEAKRFYALLALGANVALMVSGPTVYYFSQVSKGLPPGVDPWQVSLNWLMGSVVILGGVIIATYWWMQRNVLTDPRFYDPNELKKSKKNKPKMTMMESFAFLAKSKYILCIATIVIAYGISINLIEVTWKGELKKQFPSPNDYNSFMGIFSTCTGIITVMMVFIGGAIIRKKGWTFAAMATPTVLVLTGAIFFTFVIFRDSLGGFVAMFGTTPLFMAVIIGMIQNIMSKSTKYTLFDPTKEMAYIPLDQESKVKGKAAIDVVGARLGKSGGSLIQQGLLVFCGTLAAITPYVAIILFATIGAWMVTVTALGKRFNTLTATPSTPAAAEPKEAQEATAT